MKKILITGAARGLGRCLGESLSKEGNIVYGTTSSLRSEYNHESFKLLNLDLRDEKSIDRLASHFIESDEPIDVLIHNAGIAYLDPTDYLEESEIRHIFDVNFFGPINLTKKLLPQMRKANKGHLIFISSIVSIDHWPFLGVYSASKAAIESVAFEWAVLLKKWNIHVSVIRPNPLQTDMQILRSKNIKPSPYSDLPIRDLKWENIDDVCKIISKIVNEPSTQFAFQTGPHSQKTAEHFLNESAYDSSLAQYQQHFS